MIRCYLKGQLIAELKDSERDEAIALVKAGQADKISTFYGEPCRPEEKPIEEKKGFKNWLKKMFMVT